MQINMDNCDCQLSDVPVLTEDALLDPSVANSKLAKKKLKIEKIEENENRGRYHELSGRSQELSARPAGEPLSGGRTFC